MQLRAFEQRWYRVIARALLPAGVLGGTTDHRDPAALLDLHLAPNHLVPGLDVALDHDALRVDV